MSSKYAKPGTSFMDGWFPAIDEKNADYRLFARDARIVSFVQSQVKKSIDRIADIPLKCADHLTGYSVSLAVKQDEVKLLYTMPKELKDRPHWGIQHKDEPAAPLSLTCPKCGTLTTRNDVWMLTATLKALAGAKRTRPIIQIRT
ncbi:hypothetical protein [uncultured Arthrobacter sp.]|uniref:hypothetical protein n=1 Tax=uncultured Arthrobacter sp. TaxID=114050 RepID=UPI002616E54B|nr:hypothetical protein [uncultured Arthrobacter sp.]